MKQNKAKLIRSIIIGVIAALVLSVGSFLVYAYFSIQPKVYTSDDPNGQFLKAGMRIDLLFDRLDPDQIALNYEIKYGNNKTGHFDNTKPWGTKDNPYIISLPRHMINLYVLQQSGYFYKNYIDSNFDGDTYDPADPEDPSMPYFLVCEQDGTPVTIDAVVNSTRTIEIKPIGNEEYPFIGCVEGAIVDGTTTAPNGKTSKSSIIANFPVVVDKDAPDVGLFGKIGYLGDASETTMVDGVQTFNGAISSISDLLLYDVQVVSRDKTFTERVAEHIWSHDAANTVRYEEDHHVGILAGHIEYAAITDISVYYTSQDIKAIDIKQTGANYLSDCGIIGFVYHLNPEVSGNSIGSETGDTIAGSVEGYGQEWGGSIDMKTMYTRLRKTYDSITTSYVISRTVNNVTHYLCVDENGTIYDSTTASDAAHWSGNSGQIYTTVNGTNYYLYRNNTTLQLTTNENNATNWANNNNSLRVRGGNTYYYISYNNGSGTDGWYVPNSNANRATIAATIDPPQTYVSAETVLIDEVNETTSTQTTATSLYTSATYNGTTIDAAYYSSEDGGSFVFAEGSETSYAMFHGKSARFFPKTVTTITLKDEYESGFVINVGSNYLNGSYSNAAAIQNNTSGFDSASVWQLDAQGHLFTYLDTNPNNTTTNRENDIVKYYLNSSNTGVLSLSTNGTTLWAKTENESHQGTLSCDINGVGWVLNYNNGWQAIPFGDTFTVSNGNNYLGRNNSTTNFVGTNANAANWHLESGRLMTYINNTVYYLNVSNTGVISLDITATTTSWAENNGILSLTLNNDTWYLRWDGSAWTVFPSLTAYTIHSGNDYFGVTNNDLSRVAQANAVRWIIDGSKLYTPINGTKYYLVGSSDGSGDMSLTTTRASGTDFNYTIDGGTFSYIAGGETWYLYYRNNAWIAYPANSINFISQSGNNLGAASATTVGTGESAWMDDGAGHLYTYYNSSRRYLVSNGTSVTLSNTASTVWTHNPNGTVTNGDGWFLVYDNGWKCYPSLDYITITDGTNYMLRNGNSIGNTTTAANATRWFADGSKLFTVDGANTYYLRGNGAALSVDTQANATDFSYDSTNKRFTYYSENTYYVVYNNAWNGNLSTVKGVFISTTVNGQTYYLNADENGVSTGTDSGTATGWVFNNNILTTVIGSTTYYLRAELNGNDLRSSTHLAVTTSSGQATSFNYSNNMLTCTLRPNNTNTTYSLSFDNGALKMVDTNTTYYAIYSGENYFSMNGTSVYNRDADNASLWVFNNTSGTTYNIYTLYGTTRYYLRLSNSTIINTSSNTVTYSNNRISYSSGGWFSSTYYLRYNNGWERSTTQSIVYRTAIEFDPAVIEMPAAYYETSESSGEISATNTFTQLYALNNVSFTDSSSGMDQAVTVNNIYSIFTPKDYQITTKKVTTEAGGHDTYFPLVADETAPFNVNSKNTGYIVGGSHATYQETSGDVRFSAHYTFSDRRLSNAVNGNSYYSSRLEVLTRTYLSNGQVRISDSHNGSNNYVADAISDITKVPVEDLGLQKYDTARDQLGNMFGNDGYNGSIYGVHFMDSAISMNNMIIAPKVVINGQTYYNYQMPEDCIDFRLRTKGYINFFAGTYYVVSDDYSNNSFFSLNQIFRNSDNTIAEIKRIEKIYGDPTSEKKNYIYKYENEAIPSLPSGYIEMFDTDWIERPEGLVTNAMYYFEIPVNSGEYALGSVNESGRYGAYLCYLDIGTKAASHSSVIGTIDFVYDNKNDKIVVVPDTSETDTSLNYYVPSLLVMYTKNTDEDNEVDIDEFAIQVTRTIGSVNDASATLNATFTGEDDTHLTVVKQMSSGGDTINQSPAP